MSTPFALIALCAFALSLGACDKTPTSPPTPTVNRPAPTESGVATGALADPSLPSAQSVFPPASIAAAGSAPGRTDGLRNPAQESTGMPMPGQNNDHSAPVRPAKPASSP